MRNFSISPKEMVASLWRNRQLILQMSKREVIGRYRGSVFGLAWSFFNPIVMLVIYTFVFSVVFNARWGVDTGDSKVNFAIILFVGLIVHGLFAECINRAPSLIISNVNYVKKVVFPLEILPWIAFGSAAFHAVVSFFVLILAQIILGQSLPPTVFLFPFLMLPIVFGTMGMAWFLASLGVYLRDISQVTSMFTTIMLYISAVFFPVSALPERYQVLLMLNPLAFIIEEGRKVLIYGQLPNFWSWIALLIISMFVSWFGFAWFQKTRKGFADVV